MANQATATYPGRTLMWQRFRGAQTEPKNIKWGQQPPSTPLVTGSANSNVALFQPANESGVAGTSNIVQSATGFLGDTYYVSGTITCLTSPKTITEALLSDTVTNAPSASLSVSLAIGATTVSLAAATSFPTTGNFYAQIENETVLMTGAAASPFTIVRAQLGSVSVAHGVGAACTIGGDGGASGVTLGGQTATPAAIFGGSVFAHADFAGVGLNANDSILFSWFDTLI